MKYYIPKYFTAHEIFPPKIVQEHIGKGNILSNGIWRLMDSRILWTADKIRERFKTIVIINNYIWGGKFKYRGYRFVVDLIDWNRYNQFKIISPLWSSFTSQHCFGRAIDADLKGFTAQEIREDIKSNPNQNAYKYITAIEEKVNWLHFDCRNVNVNNIIFF